MISFGGWELTRREVSRAIECAPGHENCQLCLTIRALISAGF